MRTRGRRSPRRAATLANRYASRAISSKPPSGRSRIAAAQASPHAAQSRRPPASNARRAKYRARVVKKISSVSVKAAAEYSARNGHKRGQGEGELCGFRPQQAPRDRRAEEAGSQVNEHLDEQHCAVMVHAEDGEDERQKRRVAGQADIGGRDFPAAQAVNPMLQPVLGNVAVDEGIGDDSGKAKEENQPQKRAPPQRTSGRIAGCCGRSWRTLGIYRVWRNSPPGKVA